MKIYTVYDHGIWRTAELIDTQGQLGFFRCLMTNIIFQAYRNYCKEA